MANEFKALFPMNLQFFSENDPDPQPEPGDKPDEGSGKQPEKTFTQAELDEIVAKRLERERKKFERFSDYDDLKKKAEEYEKMLEEKRLAELSEKERLEEIAKKYESEKQTLAQELEQLRETIKREKIVNEFIKVATALNVAYIDDALKLADLSAVTVDEDGVKGVKEAVEALVQHKPFLLAQAKKEPKTIGNPSNPNPNEAAQKTAEQLLKEAAEKARRTGRIEDRMAYAQLKKELGL
jgi:hypothetical protein